MSREYIKSAKERTAVMWLQRVVLDRVIRSDSPPKEVVTCEEVFVQDSTLDQEDWLAVLEKLGNWEHDARARMTEYRLMKDPAPLSFLNKTAPEAEPTEEKKNAEPGSKKKRARKTEPGPERGDAG